jgi:hypothetical protein
MGDPGSGSAGLRPNQRGHPQSVPPQREMPRREATLPPLAWTGLIVGGILLVLLVVGIGIQIAILQDSRDHIRAQDAKTAVLLAKVRAAEPTTSEVAREGVPLIRAARPLVGKISRAVGPLARSGASIAVATRQLPSLTRTAQALAAVALPALTDVRQAGLVHAIAATEELLARVRDEDLVGVAARAGRETPRLLTRLLSVQLETLRVQKQSLETQLTTLDIQRQALTHIESIDRKTGGTVPPPVPAGAP